MSTRAIYTFADKEGEWTQGPFNVYKHSDGYPTGAAGALIAALQHAWPLPRYEADEFAAAFVAGNKSYWIKRELELMRQLLGDDRNKVSAKDRKVLVEELMQARDYGSRHGGGGVRLLPAGDWREHAPQDLAYRYEIAPKPTNGQLLVFAYEVNHVGETRYVKNRKGQYVQEPTPVSERGWQERKLFVAPLKSGATLLEKAKAYEAKQSEEG
jgi:hypothetical protein